VLKILPEQMRAFSGVADELLTQRLADHLRLNYADNVVKLPTAELQLSELAEGDLKAMIQGGCARARSYQISHESALAGFVALMFEAAPNFDSYPPMQRTLQDENTPPNSRVDLLLDQASEEDWAKVRESYDADAWKLSPKVNQA
jgi:hypothetical protein